MLHDRLASGPFICRMDYSPTFQSIHRSLNSSLNSPSPYFFCRPIPRSLAMLRTRSSPSDRTAATLASGLSASPSRTRFHSGRAHQKYTTRRGRTAPLHRIAATVLRDASSASFSPRHFPQERKLTAKLASPLVRVPLDFFPRYSRSDMLNSPFSPFASVIAQNAQVRH